MGQNLALYADQVPKYVLSKGLVYIRAPLARAPFDIVAPWDIFCPAVSDAVEFIAAVRSQRCQLVQMLPRGGPRR